jgi:very-short-patch-repair endonuclease
MPSPDRAGRGQALAKYQRSHPTDAERKLWALLRGKQVYGLRFRSQHPIGPYIADFFCAPAKLLVELDGDQHGTDQGLSHDAARTRWLEARGYHVLRFSNHAFLKDPASALENVWRAVESRTPPRITCGDPALPQGEG